MDEKEEINNSEILFLYGAKLCNPNGDPDEENRPRIDIKTWTNLVSDVRLKRYFRDYIINKFGEKFIWVSKVKEQHVTSDKRLESLNTQWKIGKKKLVELVDFVPKHCIDARLFGATIPIRARVRGEKGESKALVGPVQFAWGYSLHPVELVDSSTITSIFAGREVAEKYGTMGKDWRLYYSLIAFYGVVSGLRSQKTGLKRMDLKLIDNFLWDSVSLGATTRSKIGEIPHLYLRVEYTNSDTLIGDLRRYIDVSSDKTVRDLKNLKLNFDKLVARLELEKKKIKALYLRISDEMEKFGFKERLQKIFKNKLHLLPHSDKELQDREEVEKLLVIE